jgi:hypothetical protein
MLKELLDEIFFDFGVKGSGIDFFAPYQERLTRFPLRSVVEAASEYPPRFLLDMLLSVPELWRNERVDWRSIVCRNREDFSQTNDRLGGYADIEFLSRYVRVDAIQILMAMNAPWRAQSLSYFKRFAYDFVPNELDLEDLDGEYFVLWSDLDMLRTSLMAEAFAPIPFGEDDIHQYLDQY